MEESYLSNVDGQERLPSLWKLKRREKVLLACLVFGVAESYISLSLLAPFYPGEVGRHRQGHSVWGGGVLHLSLLASFCMGVYTGKVLEHYFNIKIAFPSVGIPILVRQHIYTEMVTGQMTDCTRRVIILCKTMSEKIFSCPVAYTIAIFAFDNICVMSLM